MSRRPEAEVVAEGSVADTSIETGSFDVHISKRGGDNTQAGHRQRHQS